jgi:5-formyltetrahydrofolate cyclo-ligase
VNPDAPQRPVRHRVLLANKVLLMPTPRLREGFLRLDPTRLAPSKLFAASSIKGALELGEPIQLDQLPQMDLLVFGSVAVSKRGDRVGKGEGYAELEFATLRTLGRVPDSIVIATTVNDAQVVPDIPHQVFDVTLDLICTPTRVIRCSTRGDRPSGVMWDQLPTERRQEMPILEELFQRSAATSS